MIFDQDKKLILLENPKTGTSTIRSLVKSHRQGISELAHVHIRYHRLEKELNISLDGYTVYSFYREPVERFISFYRYALSQYKKMEPEKVSYVWKALYGTDVVGDIDSITILDILDALNDKRMAPAFDLAASQTNWIVDGVALLDYRNYESECRKILERFDIFPDFIPVINSSDSKQYIKTVDSSTIAQIKDFYEEDYKILSRFGIKFD